MLPDESTGQSPGTLAEKLSRCKEGMAHFLQIKVQGFVRFTSVAVQGFSKPRTYPRLQSLWCSLAQRSRYKLSRSQKFVMVQDFICVQMRESWCKSHYRFVLGAGAKAKSVTNNLPLLSVLAVDFYFCQDITYSDLGPEKCVLRIIMINPKSKTSLTQY